MLFAKLVQERASHAGKIGNAKMRKVRAELLNSTAAFIASLHHHLITYTRSSSLPGLSGAAHKMRSVRSQTSSNALSARVSTCSVDPEARVWCISAWSIGIRSRVLCVFIPFCRKGVAQELGSHTELGWYSESFVSIVNPHAFPLAA